ncbi:isoprenyl transferase [Anaerovibrio sp. RM50]|uniref:isoprenyl transferase n=1 Tax=Anaerovibrio sp. RM50 TaxID=1200557 RepID=UPI00047FDA59|nr:isoprenyl transferase [Anaerovibrio sp. RM50]
MWKKIFGKSDKTNIEPGESLFEQIDRERLPRHIAIIMDGNGRWANGKGMVRSVGHTAGVKALKRTLKAAIALNLEAMTVYAFSTENWKRPATEVEFLMKLFSEYLEKEIAEMDSDNVCIKFIGRVNELSPGLQKQIADAEQRTANNTGVRFTVGVNYGGQDEMMRAVRSLAQDVKNGTLEPDDIDCKLIESHLDTRELPPVDLVIRTSGDMRLSNFLIWQTAYAEFWFTDTNWPDFDKEKLAEALLDFGQRERRFGGLNKKK